MITLRKPFRLLVVMVAFLPLASCNKAEYKDYSFEYWNDSQALDTLKEYVNKVTNPSNKEYIPKIDRIATFDMDGTLFGERSQIYIEWLMYHDYLGKKNAEIPGYGADTKVDVIHKDGSKDTQISLDTIDKDIYSFMQTRTSDGKLEMREAVGGAKLFSGITITKYIEYVDNFLEKDAYCFNNLKFKDMFYKPMIEVISFLQLNDFDVYIVSGTDRFMVRDIISKHLSIPVNKVIGMDVELTVNEKQEIVRKEKLMYKNVKDVKVELIAQEICKKPVLSFGNSSGDVPMHNYTLSNEKYMSQAYMVLADDNAREFGYPDEDIKAKKAVYEASGYNIFSMKNDFKTIYGDNVTIKNQ